MTANIDARREALFKRLPTSELVKAARDMEAASPQRGGTLVLFWLRNELDKRAGELDDARFCELLDSGLNYTEAVLALAPHLTNDR